MNSGNGRFGRGGFHTREMRGGYCMMYAENAEPNAQIK